MELDRRTRRDVDLIEIDLDTFFDGTFADFPGDNDTGELAVVALQ